MIKINSRAPDFNLFNQNLEKICLKDFKGKWVVLYFYPKDDTPGCTLEAKSFSKENPDFEKINAVVLGISADDCQSHKDFIDKYNLKIQLLSDPDKKLLKNMEYGVKKFYGKEFYRYKKNNISYKS